MSIESSWNQLETWLSAHHPQLLSWLNPGATEEHIQATEQALGIRLPADVRHCYAIHNGQKSTCPPFFSGEEFLSLENLVTEWQVWKELLDHGTFSENRSAQDHKTRWDWWHPAWIPFTSDHTGNNICIDLSPGPSGQLGQIIHMFHDDDRRPVLALSLEQWLGNFVTQALAGDYVLAEKYGFLVLKADYVASPKPVRTLGERFRAWLFRH